MKNTTKVKWIGHDTVHPWNKVLTKIYLWSNISNGVKKPNCSTGISDSLFHKVYSSTRILQADYVICPFPSVNVITIRLITLKTFIIAVIWNMESSSKRYTEKLQSFSGKPKKIANNFRRPTKCSMTWGTPWSHEGPRERIEVNHWTWNSISNCGITVGIAKDRILDQM